MSRRPWLFKCSSDGSLAEIIVCAVRWYLRYSLSYRELQELLAERGINADHSTIWRWVQRYAPDLAGAPEANCVFRRSRSRFRDDDDQHSGIMPIAIGAKRRWLDC